MNPEITDGMIALVKDKRFVDQCLHMVLNRLIERGLVQVVQPRTISPTLYELTEAGSIALMMGTETGIEQAALYVLGLE